MEFTVEAQIVLGRIKAQIAWCEQCFLREKLTRYILKETEQHSYCLYKEVRLLRKMLEEATRDQQSEQE